jgi:F0F1-type ATP synthase membrane subunit b/b'
MASDHLDNEESNLREDASQRSKSDQREELRLVEQELAEARQTASEQRQQIGDPADAPRDAADLSTELTTAEEQEALVARLEDRRRRLRSQLGMD